MRGDATEDRLDRVNWKLAQRQSPKRYSIVYKDGRIRLGAYFIGKQT